MIVSALSIGMMTDNVSGMIILLAFSPLSIALNYLIVNRKKTLQTMVVSTLVSLVSFILVLSLMKDASGVSIIHQLDEFFFPGYQYTNRSIKGYANVPI